MRIEILHMQIYYRILSDQKWESKIDCKWISACRITVRYFDDQYFKIQNVFGDSITLSLLIIEYAKTKSNCKLGKTC